jgi:hypothetical protein
VTAGRHSEEDVVKGPQGKVAVVTGGSSGIGQAIAVRLGTITFDIPAPRPAQAPVLEVTR